MSFSIQNVHPFIETFDANNLSDFIYKVNNFFRIIK